MNSESSECIQSLQPYQQNEVSDVPLLSFYLVLQTYFYVLGLFTNEANITSLSFLCPKSLGKYLFQPVWFIIIPQF